MFNMFSDTIIRCTRTGFRIDPRRGDCQDNGLCGCLDRYVLIDEACVPGKSKTRISTFPVHCIEY